MAVDPFKSSRLGDLPNDGYSTRRERELSDAVMLFMRAIERDRKVLLLIVVEGPDVFRGRMLKEWRGLRPARDLVDKVFQYFVRQAGPNPLGQLEALSRMTNRERYGLM